MTIKGSGISDTSRVLKVSKGTVISAIARQEDQLVSVNPNIRQLLAEEDGMAARILPACEEAELDEQWPFVGPISVGFGMQSTIRQIPYWLMFSAGEKMRFSGS